MQIVLFCEASSESGTDFSYIREYIHDRYPDKRRLIHIDKVSLGSKTKYEKGKRKAADLIKKYALQHKHEKQVVICCFDTDIGKTGAEETNDKIVAFCKTNGYELVWFHRDIEEVFLGNHIPDKDKLRCAKNFVERGNVKGIKDKKMMVPDPRKGNLGTSNLKGVLDKYLTD